MNETLDRLVTITLAHVERDRRTDHLVLRAIAREAGCSHVNVYNHVKNLDELLWHAYCRAMVRYRDWSMARVAEARPDGSAPRSPLLAWVRAALDFARDHEGLWRLLWLDRLSSPPPDFAVEGVEPIAGEFHALVAASIGETGAREKADTLAAWMLGQVSFLVNGRAGPDREAAEARIMHSAGTLITLLASAGRPQEQSIHI